MLQDVRMAAMRKLRRSKGKDFERQQWAETGISSIST
jgi:hypothetical protein